MNLLKIYLELQLNKKHKGQGVVHILRNQPRGVSK